MGRFSLTHTGKNAYMYRAANNRLGIVSTYVPRRCGLATYTADLREALGVAAGDIDPVIVAIDRDGLSYGDEVVATIHQDRISDYENAVDKIQAAGVDVVLIQHEYGIFGGPNGSYVLHLARALTRRGIPYLVTLHTLLSNPSPGQAATLAALCAGAARVTVFTETARRMALRARVASSHQITVVPHGAPDILRTEVDRANVRPEVADLLDRIGDDPLLATFGLVSVNKGLDDAIRALGEVVKRHPRTRYVIAGATHPEIVRQEGESYRESLIRRVRELGLEENVHFIDSFLSPEELSALLSRTTIFITSYRSPEQICSGALTFAVAAGCPVVSTSYLYAQDLLADGAGVVVPCLDVDGLAHGIIDLLDSPEKLAAAKAAADARGARLVWPAVALSAVELIRTVVAEARAGGNGRLVLPPTPVPQLNLSHLKRLTDEIGIIEFCKGTEPDLAYGYNVDDVSRLGIVAARLLSVGPAKVADIAERWARLAIRFLRAAHRPGGIMHNRMSYSGSWTDLAHRGDHVGRAVWALGGLATTAGVPEDVRRSAWALFNELTPYTPPLAACGLRSVAYATLGLATAARAADKPARELPELVGHLATALERSADYGWYWFEPALTYDNTRLPQALMAGAAVLGDSALVARALTALDWYTDHAGLTSGVLRNVGNKWHHRDQDPAQWLDDGDEQPIDTASAVEAMVEAWRHTGEDRYASLAAVAFSWFSGRNRIHTPMYDTRTGGCHDGLTPSGPNPNFGAESTLAFPQATLALVAAGLAVLPDRIPVEKPAADRVSNDRSAGARTDRAGTVRASERTNAARPDRANPTRPAHRTRTTEGQPDA
jgi:glycosyltransferase involved in cell wall biosynthesis